MAIKRIIMQKDKRLKLVKLRADKLLAIEIQK